MINIVIADREFLLKEGLRCLLSKREDLQIVAETSNNEEMVKALQIHQPEVLIVDFDQEGAFELADVAKAARRFPNTKILVISNNKHKHEILSALECGISSYLLKECDAGEIFDAIYATANGEQFFCAQILENILEKKSPMECGGLFLTNRELEIVKLVAEGHTTAQIAQMLSRSVHTINTHRKNIMQKLGLSNPSELVLYALKRGIIAA